MGGSPCGPHSCARHPNIGSDCQDDALKHSDTPGGLRWPIHISDERSAPSWTSKGEAIHE
ncbi:hypothetical protein GOC15_23985 [Sinorhizobium meliloti]|nr:hypothetical protein [Sinorhizobium meliloti]MDX0127640.1 hypothetical protein [Sinorhizobium meliloti]MDX0332098.1 hypothetical protein [Sinorhizobium meliloti]MQV57643.1 hypothetical protein [Sinorhizobium meliloti]